MREFSLNKEPDIIVTARFIESGKGLSVNHPDVIIRLYDHDQTNDEFLGQAAPDEQGRIEISFSHDAFVNEIVFKEAKPDFYFVIFYKDKPVHSTKIMQDFALEDIQRFKMGKGEVVDLGTFLVPSF
jgi:hypothetical protein